MTFQSNNSRFDFFVTELFVFLSQVFVIFLVAVFTSDFLRNEDRLVEFVTSRVNKNFLSELGLTLLAITVAIGLLTIVKTFGPEGKIEALSQKLLTELPHTIYFFGSSITATTLSVAIFTANHSQSESMQASSYSAMAAFFAISTFIYGFGLKALVLSKTKRNAPTCQVQAGHQNG